MAETARRVLMLAGLAAGAVALGPARAAEPPRAAAVAKVAPTPTHAASAAATEDLELLEFLGSDDEESEFQEFLASQESAKVPASGRSDKK